MADFCAQCSVVIYGEDTGDFADPDIPPGHVRRSLCEGCGPTLTNAAGECVTDCDLHHSKPEGNTPMHKTPTDHVAPLAAEALHRDLMQLDDNMARTVMEQDWAIYALCRAVDELRELEKRRQAISDELDRVAPAGFKEEPADACAASPAVPSAFKPKRPWHR